MYRFLFSTANKELNISSYDTNYVADNGAGFFFTKCTEDRDTSVFPFGFSTTQQHINPVEPSLRFTFGTCLYPRRHTLQREASFLFALLCQNVTEQCSSFCTSITHCSGVSVSLHTTKTWQTNKTMFTIITLVMGHCSKSLSKWQGV